MSGTRGTTLGNRTRTRMKLQNKLSFCRCLWEKIVLLLPRGNGQPFRRVVGTCPRLQQSGRRHENSRAASSSAYNRAYLATFFVQEKNALFRFHCRKEFANPHGRLGPDRFKAGICSSRGCRIGCCSRHLRIMRMKAGIAIAGFSRPGDTLVNASFLRIPEDNWPMRKWKCAGEEMAISDWAKEDGNGA